MVCVINFSGGKDSCAMLAYICENYPNVEKHVVFADTGWEHPGAEDWCRKIVSSFGLQLHVVKKPNNTFLTMVEKRGMFPGPQQRQCTSDLKRDPIFTWIRRNVKSFEIINCMGLRAEESPSRKRKEPYCLNKRQSNSKRKVYDWLPIHSWSTDQVLNYLDSKGIPLHPVYSYLKRFSCRVCIYMTDDDLKAVAANDPEAIAIISELEEKVNYTIKPGKTLVEIIDSG